MQLQLPVQLRMSLWVRKLPLVILQLSSLDSRGYETNPEFLACQKKFEEIYLACIVDCGNGGSICLAACVRDFDKNLLDCPCMENCSDGCPCDSYECEQTTTTSSVATTVAPKTSVLVLNTFREYNVPVKIYANGRADNSLDFTIAENTQVAHSCSVTFRNQNYVLGGHLGNSRQIGRIEGCRLETIGRLPFSHRHATCTTVGDDRIYLCFNVEGTSDYKQCRYATQPDGPFFDVPFSNHDHRLSRIASSAGNI